ncbi:Fc.00g048910.m01.CDS01 [Cosmosporella sp. VM-42]
MSNETAKTLKALHKPSSPIIFPNVWDHNSFNVVTSLNTADSKPVKGLATASWAIAQAIGVNDEDLTLEQNFDAISKVAPLAQAAGLPLSADLMDGCGDQITSAVSRAVKLGVVGANIEDSIPSAGFGKGIDGSLYSLDTQVQRLKDALAAAKEAGCPDFVLNARCDIFRLDGDLDDETRMEEAIKRGKAYLELGATTIFYWGGSGPGRGLRTAQVERLVKELDGKVAVKLGGSPDSLTTAELAKIGVARISVGPSLFIIANMAMKKAAASILAGGSLLG